MTAMKLVLRDLLWLLAGAALFLVGTWVVPRTPRDQSLSASVALKARKVDSVEQMRLALASASEAEKSAVMATTDQDSQSFADQARAATTALREERARLDKILVSGGNTREERMLAKFSDAFADFERIDRELLSLAVQNTNLKAYDLAFGPAAAVLRDMDEALARIVKERAGSPSSDDGRIVVLAEGARIAALRIQALLPPHIAEESERKMDEMESRMAGEDREARKNLAALSAIQGLTGNADLAAASERYAAFSGIQSQILKLSRENTNVRSKAISLIQKRRVMFLCQDALAALQQAIEEEPGPAGTALPR